MVASSAVARTSAGAPWLTCSASVALESKANRTLTPGCRSSNSWARVVKVPVSEAAPSTVSVLLPSPCVLPADGSEPQPVRQRTAARTGTAPSCATSRQLHDDVGGLHRGDRQHPGLQAELLGRLAAHQRHQSVGTADHLHLSHHRVLLDRGDDAPHPVAGADRGGTAHGAHPVDALV